MNAPSSFVRLSALVLFGTIVLFGQSDNTNLQPAAEAPAAVVQPPAVTDSESAPHESAVGWFENSIWKPVTHFFWSLSPIPVPAAEDVATTSLVSPFVAQAGCSVTPLEAVTDSSATELEASNSPGGPIDTKDMIPAAARALDLFATKIASVGGSLVLHSAYRPEAYQRHLQDVWYKWMEMKNNGVQACQGLRTAVQAEFVRHHLLESQHPVAVSDHTRGLAFDASVDLPRNARIGRRKVTVDLLARLAGLVRPALVADPVHFKFLGGMPRVGILTAARHAAPGRRLLAARRVRNG